MYHKKKGKQTFFLTNKLFQIIYFQESFKNTSELEFNEFGSNEKSVIKNTVKVDLVILFQKLTRLKPILNATNKNGRSRVAYSNRV
jgi:hypothetical protein